MNEFDEIYSKGGWDGLGSGPGSTEAFTRGFRKVFENLIKEKKIKSVFDLGCGDWQWQQHVNWGLGEMNYVGWDISDIAYHRAYPPSGKLGLLSDFRLEVRDAFREPLWPEADLLLVKDLVHHISPYRVRQLVERAKLYDYVLWVLDINSDGSIINRVSGMLPISQMIYRFDTSVENYRYGPKCAFLQTNI